MVVAIILLTVCTGLAQYIILVEQLFNFHSFLFIYCLYCRYIHVDNHACVMMMMMM